MSHQNVVLRQEIKRLRAALNQQCQRVYQTNQDMERLLILLRSGVRAVERASNSVPCSMPGCDLCRWHQQARLQSGAVNWRCGQRAQKTHALEAHLGEES